MYYVEERGIGPMMNRISTIESYTNTNMYTMCSISMYLTCIKIINNFRKSVCIMDVI